MEPKLELILWNDAHNDYHGWQHPEAIKIKPALVKSAGFVVKESDAGVVLALDYDPDGNMYNGCGFIPASLIVSRQTILVQSLRGSEQGPSAFVD